VTAGWNDGFFIQTPNGDTRLHIGFVVQADGRFSLDDPAPIIDTLVLRKVRPTFTGRIATFIDFKVMPEMAGGSVQLLDGYFDIRFSPKFRLRSGKDKTPIGYELLLGDAYLIFPERSVVSQLVPNRDVGFQAQGDLAGGKILYAGGVFNGNPADGTNTIADVDTNSGKDLAGRVVILPFRSARSPHALSNLGFHLGGSTGSEIGALPSFRTSAGQTYFSFPAATTADGRRNRVSPAVFLYRGPFGGFAEYARTTQDIVTSGVPRTVTNQAWGVAASYVLTGETTSDRGVRPRAPFDPAAGAWGAVQLAVRYVDLTLDGELLAPGIAAAGSSRNARQLTLAANWFLNNYTKIYATYERFDFSGPRPNENVVIVRAQLGF
jgi:phosphate-selective porin OprO/OprP